MKPISINDSMSVQLFSILHKQHGYTVTLTAGNVAAIYDAQGNEVWRPTA